MIEIPAFAGKTDLIVMLNRRIQFALAFITLLMGVSFATQTNAAVQWVANPEECRNTDATYFPGQNCTAPTNICGDWLSAGTAQCFDTGSMPSPPWSADSSAYVHSSLHTGGYVVNCYATADLGEPYCNNNGNFWCNSDTSCFNDNRVTTCATSTFAYQDDAFSCGSCMTDWGDCDSVDACEIHFNDNAVPYLGRSNTVYADCTTPLCSAGYLDCNNDINLPGSNGCEILDGGACFDIATGLPGIQEGCDCVMQKQNFQTNTEAKYATSGAFLWGQNYGVGDLIRFGNGTSTEVFVVSNDGVLKISSTTVPGDTSNKLYNIEGQLYWNGAPVSGGSSSSVFTSLVWENATGTGDTVLNNLTVTGSANFDTASINNLYVTGNSYGINLIDIIGSSTVAYLTQNQVFSGVNSFTATTTFSTTTASSTITENLVLPNMTAGSILFVGADGNVSEKTEQFFWDNNSDRLGIGTNAPDDGITIYEYVEPLSICGNPNGCPGKGLQIGNGSSTSSFKTGLIYLNQSAGNPGGTFAVESGDVSASGTLRIFGDAEFVSNITTEGYLVVSTSVRSNLYCDKDGNNCFDPSAGGWGGTLSQIVTTTVTTSGHITHGLLRGYDAANAICDDMLEGSHFCFTGEILSLNGKGATAVIGATDAWIAEGPPGYTSNSNDCNGYTTDSDLALGAFWAFDSNGGGMGWLINCSESKKLVCCK